MNLEECIARALAGNPAALIEKARALDTCLRSTSDAKYILRYSEAKAAFLSDQSKAIRNILLEAPEDLSEITVPSPQAK